MSVTLPPEKPPPRVEKNQKGILRTTNSQAGAALEPMDDSTLKRPLIKKPNSETSKHMVKTFSTDELNQLHTAPKS